MYGAIKNPTTGRYIIVSAYPDYKSTRRIREKLKRMGGIWMSTEKQWVNIEEKFLKDIPASKRLKVLLAPHRGVSDDPKEIFVFEHQIVNNQVRMLDWGDDHVWVDVQEILGEA
jgi:hypothetical protein